MELKVFIMKEASDFIKSMPKPVGRKIHQTIRRVENGELNPVIFAKLDGTNIWEFRILFNNVKYRLFAFWDTQSEALVIATHGIIKKTQKTPKKEMAKAERIRQEFFNAKRR